MNDEREDSTDREQVVEPRVGRAISLLSLPLGAFLASTGLTGVWNLFRELYCRTYHEKAHMLCIYFSWDFRGDAAVVFIASLVIYAAIHLRYLCQLTRRGHIRAILLLGVLWLLIIGITKLVPGKWEAW